MDNRITYVHTNLIARDWKRLAQFYMDVFGCKPLYPERDLSGAWLDDVIGIAGAEIRGIHLRLPGYGKGGPTLEIFEYNKHTQGTGDPEINQPGFSHIAFKVENVEEIRDKILARGGSLVGALVEKEIPGVGKIKVVYARDPEKNIIEIQKITE